MEVKPTIATLLLVFNHVHTPVQVPVRSPPKIVPINRTAPEQS